MSMISDFLLVLCLGRNNRYPQLRVSKSALLSHAAYTTRDAVYVYDLLSSHVTLLINSYYT